MIRLIVPTVLLTLVYALVLASFDPWDLGLGAALALALVVLLQRAGLETGLALPPGSPRRFFAFFPFAAAVVWDILVSTGRVLAFVVAPRSAAQPGIVELPLGERTPLGVAVSALVVCIAPGSTVLAIDWHRRVMVVHLLDARDPGAVREQQQTFYERYQRHVFP